MPLDQDARSRIVDALLTQLAVTFSLYLETQFAYWNVTGLSFFELHRAFRKQNRRLLKDIDRIAERIRALDVTIEMEQAMEAPGGEMGAEKLCKALADGHAAAADGAREAYAVAEEAGDVATAMLFEDLAFYREKEAWHLRAYYDASLTEAPAQS